MKVLARAVFLNTKTTPPKNAVFPIVAMFRFRLFAWIQVAKELQQLQSAFNVNVMSITNVFCVFPISTSKAEIDETGILGIWFGSAPPETVANKGLDWDSLS